MSSNSREIGTLIAVVLKANHLPNKRHIGKQDPYCVVTVNGEKRRTKAIKRGGQHPEWDEEIRFTLIEDTDASDQATQKSDSPPHLPPKSSRGPKKIKGGLSMKVACFADDPREPDFIGEADVDLTEVLTKGETDEWFTLTNKDKFAGKVYLELTFWSNEPPPEKKTSKPQKTKYAGPGYFNPSEEHPHPASRPRISSTPEHSRLSDSVSSVLRVPNPNAQSELLYDPPYVQRHRVSPLDRVSNDFGELDVADHRSSSHSGHLTSSVSSGYSATIPQPTHSFDFSAPELTYVGIYEQSGIPHGSTQPQQSIGVPSVLQPGYSQAQDAMPASGYPQSNRRHRIPTSSSGFVPLHASNSLPSHPSEPTSLPSYSTTLTTHNPHYPTQTYTSVLSQAPPSTTFVQGTTLPFNPQPYPVSQPTQYSHYVPIIPMPTPNIPSAVSYINSQASAPPALPHNTPYVNGNTPSPTHDQTIQPLHAQTPVNAGSRPLPPQPQINFGQSRVSGVYTATQAVSPQHTLQQSNVAYQSVPFPPPQPPPLPPINYGSQTYSTEPQSIVPPPPPLPESEQVKAPARRRSSLPRPPVNYVQSDVPPPPPPPLPTNGYFQGQLPPPPPPLVQNGQAQFSHPGPPPKPPVMVDIPSQWLPSYNSPPLQNGYGHAM